MKIAFFDAKPYDILSFNKQNEAYGYKIKYLENKLDEDTAILAKGYDVVCAFVNDTLNRPVVEQLNELGVKLIAMRCAGYNNVDFEATAEFNIPVVRVPAYSPYAVAEHAIALLMTLNRKTHKAYNRTRENNFNINGLLGYDLYGKTIGVVGTGKIGRVFAQICKGFGMRVLAYDAYEDKNLEVAYVSLDELYAQSHIISLHCPLNKETHYMINEASLEKMRDGVIIINTSRGALIDSEALIMGIKSKKVGAAGLDVYEEEGDYFFEDYSEVVIDDEVLSRLLSFTNVIITSHQAFFTREALENIASTTLTSVLAYEKGEKLECEVVEFIQTP